MIVRPAISEDASAIAQVHVRTWQQTYPGIVPAEYLASLSVERYETMWRANIAQGTPELLVCVDAATVLGWVAFDRSRDEETPDASAEIWAFYVAQEHWRKGVGRRLWEHAAGRLRQKGFTEASLWVLPQNTRAQHFYESMGFVIEPGSLKQFQLGSTVLDEVRFRRRL